MLFSKQEVQTFALKKDNFISISIVEPKITKTVVPPKVEKAQPVAEPVEEPAKPVDINNLFSDVWTKKIDYKKEERPKPKNNRRLLEIQKKIKVAQREKDDSLLKKVQAATAGKKSQEDAVSTAKRVNEYLAKIQAIVYQYFHVPPNSEGNSVKTVIELDAFGKVLDFRILNYSANDALNEEADKIKSRLLHVTFPKNPKNESSRTVVILISKE